MTQPDFKHSIFARLDATIEQFEDTIKELTGTLSDSRTRKSKFILMQLRREILNIRDEATASLTRLNTFGATLEIMATPEAGVDAVLTEVMRWFLLLTQCERGFVSLYDKGEEAFLLSISENWIDTEIRPMEHSISEVILGEVQKSKDIFTSSNMDMASSTYQKSGSWRVPLRTVMGIPLIRNNELIGVFYGDKKITSGAVSQDMIPLFKLYGAQAAIAIRNAQLFADLSKAK